jgi:hypothetical protein
MKADEYDRKELDTIHLGYGHTFNLDPSQYRREISITLLVPKNPPTYFDKLKERIDKTFLNPERTTLDDKLVALGIILRDIVEMHEHHNHITDIGDGLTSEPNNPKDDEW